MICVLGRTGQVAMALQEELAGKSGNFVFIGREEADFSEPQKVVAALEKRRPTLVINAVAYTAVDQAEKEREAAFRVNAETVGEIAKWCGRQNVPFIHYSTDYVYSGDGETPWVESAPIAPPNVYGESKAAGEKAVRDACPKHLILRTSWVYHSKGKNFVKTMLRLGADRESLGVVADQVGSPTSASAIARATLALVERIESGRPVSWGTYNFAGNGFTSWQGFAEEIFSQARELGLPLKVREVKKIATSEYPTPAKRPLNSRLNQEKLRTAFDLSLPTWQQSLRECLLAIREGSAS